MHVRRLAERVFSLPPKSETIVTGNAKGERDHLDLPFVVGVVF